MLVILLETLPLPLLLRMEAFTELAFSAPSAFTEGVTCHRPASAGLAALEPLTAASQGVPRLGGKGLGRNVNSLRAVFCKAMQNRVEGWESACTILLEQLLDMN